MGQGGHLWIINATSKILKVVGTKSYQMECWKFSDIPGQSKQRFYIEYSQCLCRKSEDAGEVTFQIEGTNSSFQLLIRWFDNEGECGLKVDWSGIKSAEDYTLFPPALPGESFGKLGWIHNGSLSLLLLERGVVTSIPTDVPGEGSIVGSVSTVKYPLTPLCECWMEYYSDLLGKLTLTEMTLPGTHDSGTRDPVFCLGKPWNRTQSLSLSDQLCQGIRVLDLRIGQKSPGDYIICHSTWHTRCTLAAALRQVKAFIDSTKKEIVILDFHQFVNLGNEKYDYAQLQHQIMSELSGYCLPADKAMDTLQSIWLSLSPSARVVVAWNHKDDQKPEIMWPGVDQKWYRHAHTISELYTSVMQDMRNPPGPHKLWAACTFTTVCVFRTPYRNAKNLNPTITNWYFGGSLLCEKANIISVDFFRKFSNVVQASILANLLKAGRK